MTDRGGKRAPGESCGGGGQCLDLRGRSPPLPTPARHQGRVTGGASITATTESVGDGGSRDFIRLLCVSFASSIRVNSYGNVLFINN